MSGKKAEKPKTMAEQLAAASKKLEKVETKETPTITAAKPNAPGAPMSLAEQLQAAQAKMKKAPAESPKPMPTPPPQKPVQQMSMQEQLQAAKLKPVGAPNTQKPVPVAKTPQPDLDESLIEFSRQNTEEERMQAGFEFSSREDRFFNRKRDKDQIDNRMELFAKE